MPGVPLDALAQVKRGLRSLFNRRKKKKQPTQPEPDPSSYNAPTQTTTAAAAPAPVEAPTTSNRDIEAAEDATDTEQPPAPPPHPTAAPTPSTAAAQASGPPPLTTGDPTSSDLQPSSRHPHISAPSQIEEAKEIDLNPARDIKSEESGTVTATEASDVNTGLRADVKPKLENETGMSATSGPMGDHMAEVWRDSDVGVKEGRPVELKGKAEGTAGEGGGEAEGGKF